MAFLDINTDAVVEFTNKLEKLHRSGLPNAVRSSLNDVAFDLKKRTLLLNTEKEFTIRKKSFFKAKSRVSRARGFNTKTMQSIVGFVGNDQAIKNLEKQERGGTINGRSFIPTPSARTSGSTNKNVRKKHRLKNISTNVKRVRNARNFKKTVHQEGVGGFILYRKMLYEIKRISRGNIKLLPLYSYKKSRSVQVESTNFMKESSLQANQGMEEFYVRNAKKQIRRLKFK